jgi:hypothetical protein
MLADFDLPPESLKQLIPSCIKIPLGAEGGGKRYNY